MIGTPYCKVVIPPFPTIGCTDTGALNYNPSATVDDFSCHYDRIDLEDFIIPSTTGFIIIATTTGHSTTGHLTTGTTTGAVAITTTTSNSVDVSTTTTESEPDNIVKDSDDDSTAIGLGPIIGIVIGGLGCLAVTIIGVLLLFRRKSNKKDTDRISMYEYLHV